MVWTILYFKTRLCTLLSEWRALPLEAIIDTTYIFFFFPTQVPVQQILTVKV